MVIKKDFNILGKKVSTTNAKKDIGTVSDVNSYIQKIEHILKTQKGELPADLAIGADFFSYRYNLPYGSGFLESDIRNAVSYGIFDLISVTPKITYFDTEKIVFQVNFEVLDSVIKQNNSCTIEVSLQ